MNDVTKEVIWNIYEVIDTHNDDLEYSAHVIADLLELDWEAVYDVLVEE